MWFVALARGVARARGGAGVERARAAGRGRRTRGSQKPMAEPRASVFDSARATSSSLAPAKGPRVAIQRVPGKIAATLRSTFDDRRRGDHGGADEGRGRGKREGEHKLVHGLEGLAADDLELRSPGQPPMSRREASRAALRPYAVAEAAALFDGGSSGLAAAPGRKDASSRRPAAPAAVAERRRDRAAPLDQQQDKLRVR